MLMSSPRDQVVLRVLTPELRRAFHDGKSVLEGLVGAGIPSGWPEFPQAFSLQQAPPDPRWPSYLFVDTALASLVGNGGFVGPPDGDGMVEIGYEIAPAHRNRGYATAAVRGMLRQAFVNGDAKYMIAHTLAEQNASVAVLRRTGFRFDGELPNAKLGPVWRWRLARADAMPVP